MASSMKTATLCYTCKKTNPNTTFTIRKAREQISFLVCSLECCAPMIRAMDMIDDVLPMRVDITSTDKIVFTPETQALFAKYMPK